MIWILAEFFAQHNEIIKDWRYKGNQSTLHAQPLATYCREHLRNNEVCDNQPYAYARTRGHCWRFIEQVIPYNRAELLYSNVI